MRDCVLAKRFNHCDSVIELVITILSLRVILQFSAVKMCDSESLINSGDTNYIITVFYSILVI